MDLALQLEQEFTSTHDRFIESWEACNQSFLVLNNMASGTQKPLSDLTRRADTLLHHVTWFRTCYSVDVARLEIEISTFGENHSEHWLRLNARDLTALVRQLSLPQHEVGSEKSPEVDARHLIAVVASLLSKEPSSKAKKMSAFEYSTLTFVHTSLKVVQALTTRLDPLQPKSNSIGKFLRESRRYLSSSFPKAAKLNREHTPEPDTLKGNNAAETIEDENTENSHQSRQLEPPCVPDTKGVESICEDSNEEQPSESEFISRLSTSGVEELSSEFFRFKQQKFQAALRAVDHFHSEWQAVDEQGRSAIKRLEESSSLHERQYHQLDSKLCDMFLHLQNGIENLQSRQQELQRKRASAHLSVRWSTSQALDDLWLLVLRCISAPQEPNKRNTVKDALAELQRLKSTLKRYSSSEAFSSFTDNNGRFTEASYIPLSLAEELAKANSDQSVAEAIKSVRSISEFSSSTVSIISGN
ncbi:hypothetical protein BT96DRAFT_422528 [Gymnopus androsaceus JB14]|uniref:Uncharacterized protein n=1 Tax=Gymnopus androsaceus JB14 TaxID=1447944 RepID=A0A6A4GUA9_9AGAR|nr:hypothetical protein BT96DRAFT_422528 [Gymnopus androsaceus JB14]